MGKNKRVLTDTEISKKKRNHYHMEERRFQKQNEDPIKRWKLSPMDLKSRALWVEYSKAKDVMFAHTDTKHPPSMW